MDYMNTKAPGMKHCCLPGSFKIAGVDRIELDIMFPELLANVYNISLPATVSRGIPPTQNLLGCINQRFIVPGNNYAHGR
jgi:hypothetical protein